MTEREILQEARDALELAIKAVKDHIEFAESEYGQLREWDELVKNKYSQHDPYKFHFKKIDKFQQVITNIDTALADHSPDTGNTDAEQLVGQIRDHFHSDPDEDGIRKTEWDIDIDEAAALIEQYAKRVPRALLEETYSEGFEAAFGTVKMIDHDTRAAKYGYKVEDKND